MALPFLAFSVWKVEYETNFNKFSWYSFVFIRLGEIYLTYIYVSHVLVPLSFKKVLIQ